jgi:alpha-L-rhamnosidase
MKIRVAFFLLFFCFFLDASGDIRPVDLRCEYFEDPLAVDILQPRLGWINIADKGERMQYQTSWEIRVASTPEKLAEPDLWNSGKVESDPSTLVRYAGVSLASRQDCWWQVRVWDREGQVSAWSEPAFWSMGLLEAGDWQGSWIGAPWQGEEAIPRPSRPRRIPGSSIEPTLIPGEIPPPAPMLRKAFKISGEIASARAYVTGLGFFELYLNGLKVSEDVMVPNVTLYGKRDDLGPIGALIRDNFREYRVMYLAYDVKDLLEQGENVIGTILGNGFYNPASYWCQGYGSPRFLGQLHVKYEDGREEVITSDQSWKASTGPIIMDMVYDGEHYDARLEKDGWSTVGFDASDWEPVVNRIAPEGILKAHMSPVDRIMEKLPPHKIEKLGEGHYRVDFGEEISGWVRLQDVSGNPGQRIEIKYICESSVGQNSYTMKGGGPETYAARFTWFVFREVEIRGWPGEITAGQIVAEAVYSNVETTGEFECSNPLFNKIQKIWHRSQTDNMHGGIASDCPHRERSPYTGDGQVACVTVLQNFDARTFYTKWIRDMLGAQNPENGYVPNGAPWQPGCGGGVAWGAALIIMPWEFYLQYGDLDMLRENFEGMMGYIKYMLTWTDEDGIMFSQAPEKENPNRWMNLGDWCAPGELPPDEMVHTFYLWRCADLTAKAAKALGHEAETRQYGNLAEKTRQAFLQRFYDESKGTYGPAGGNIFALKMGVPEKQYEKVIHALKSDIEKNDGHLDTGIFGTQFFFEVLSAYDLHELAYEAMNKKSEPGYGWWIQQGATTTWERWDGGGSRNHPMFGGGITWFYKVLAGMNPDPAVPGYRHIIFRPQPAADITFVSYANRTTYGRASIDWKKEGKKFIMDIAVPVGCTATVHVPSVEAGKVKESNRNPGQLPEVTFLNEENGYAIYKVGSGQYQFISHL